MVKLKFKTLFIFVTVCTKSSFLGGTLNVGSYKILLPQDCKYDCSIRPDVPCK